MVTMWQMRKTVQCSIDVCGVNWKNFFAQIILFLTLHSVCVTSLVRYHIVKLLCDIYHLHFLGYTTVTAVHRKSN